MRGPRRYLLVALLPVCVLLAAPVRPALILTFGERVRLATLPVDPRDIFRGDYVTLRFAVESVPLASFDLPPGEDSRVLETADSSPSNPHESGSLGPMESPADQARRENEERSRKLNRVVAVKDWYVPLERDELGLFRAVGARTTPPEGVYLQGTVRYAHDPVTLDFGPGLERFYLRENTGRRLEDAARRGQIEAIVKVWRGMPVIVSLDVKADPSLGSEASPEMPLLVPLELKPRD